MIQFNALKINDCGTELTIDVSVQSLNYYTNVYIDSIIIDTQDTYVNNGPSSSPVYTKTVEGNNKNVRLTLRVNDFLGKITDFNSNLLFVYVKTKGNPSPDTPCSLDNKTTLGVVYNTIPIYDKGMLFLNEMYNDCGIPKGLINYILEIKALELSIRTKNYIRAIEYWNKHFKGKYNHSVPNCNCRYGEDN